MRVWSIAAFDGDECVVVVESRDMGNNRAKDDAFTEQLDAKGYTLSLAQHKELNETLLLDACPPVFMTNESLHSANSGVQTGAG